MNADLNIAVLHAGALGDCVLAVHLAALLRANWSARMTLIARSPIAKWAAGHGFTDGALSLDEVGAHRWFAGAPTSEVVEPLTRFERIVSLLGSSDEPITEKLRTMSRRPVLAIDPRPDPAHPATHVTRQWLEQIEAQWGAKLGPAETPQLPPTVRAKLRTALADRLQAMTGASVLADVGRRPAAAGIPSRTDDPDRPIVLIHPGSGGRAKCCPIDALEALFREFHTCNWRAAWMIGPDELERDGPPFIERLQTSGPVLFEESLIAAADLAAGADAYIGNDAGMTHVAALAGVPTIALFGPTDPRVWRPLGAQCETIGFPTKQPLQDWARSTVTRVIPS